MLQYSLWTAPIDHHVIPAEILEALSDPDKAKLALKETKEEQEKREAKLQEWLKPWRVMNRCVF